MDDKKPSVWPLVAIFLGVGVVGAALGAVIVWVCIRGVEMFIGQ